MQVELADCISSIKNGDYDASRIGIAPDSFVICDSIMPEMRLPLYIRGGAAVIFKAMTPQGDPIAIRVPLGELPGKSYWNRMEKLSKKVSDEQIKSESEPISSPLLPFDVVDKGIRVRGNWISVIKMRFLSDFKPLVSRVVELHKRKTGDHRKCRGALRSVSLSLNQLGEFLERNGWDHGDISHGNIMVSDSGEVKLIDPDTFRHRSIPEPEITEVGHPSCAHPRRRNEGRMEDDLFMFPLRLLLLQVDFLATCTKDVPKLDAEADEICVAHEDLKDPDNSRAFRLMRKNGFEERVNEIVAACKATSVPSANKLLKGFYTPRPIPPPPRMSRRSMKRGLGGFEPSKTMPRRSSPRIPMKIPGLLMKSTCPPKSANAETPEIVEQMVRVVEEDYGDGKRYYTCSVAKGVGDKIGIRPRDAARGAGKRGFVELMEESRLRTEFDGDTADPYRLMRVIA